MLRVRLLRPFGPFEIETETALFSTAIASDEAEALLCEWAPHEEMLSFPGPSAWYTAEPRTNRRIGVLAHPDQRSFLGRVRPEQLLHHAHEDPRFRVPHMTHETPDPCSYEGPRRTQAATVVSNYGGPIHNRGPGIRLRNRFVTAPGVALYGRRDKWKHYRARSWSLPRLPATFAGDALGDKIELLALYHTAICLENTAEPYYFSEKFVDAVRAGCVPVYHAHPTVRDGVLAGAVWVDPEAFDFDAEATLAHAATLDRAAVAKRNFAWLRTDGVHATSRERVWEKIAVALRAQRDPGVDSGARPVRNSGSATS